jgi:hypothetical protein
MSSDKNISYFNTLIFTIITGIACLMLLILLFFDIGKQFIYFIIAFEIGIFIIIGYCIAQIVIVEKKKNDGTTNYVVKFDECPDYYTKQLIDSKEYCLNEYMGRNEAGTRFLIKIFPAEINGQPITPPSDLTGTPQLYEKFPLRGLETDANIRKMADKCNLLFKEPAVPSATYSNHMYYKYIPWTYAKSRCESIASS